MRGPFPAVLVGGIILIGLALRIWSARGGLWLDEAWSAVFAERAKTPLGIFLTINHDNNHHLNTLWMQLCGFGASPFLVRALSITTGTVTIVVAAAIGARQSITHALIAALLFAVSPILVNYGSEARGYAPMLLASMLMIWCMLYELDRPVPGDRRAALILGVLALTGMLFQLTMLFFVAAIGVWTAWTLKRRMSARSALAMAIRLLLPAFGASILVIAMVVFAAEFSPTGMRVGDYLPFSFSDWSSALAAMVTTTLGLSFGGAWSAACAMLWVGGALILRARRPAPTTPLQVVAALAFPLMFPLFEIGNSGMPRYYLLSTIAILLLVVDVSALALTERRTRIGAGIALLLLTAACLNEDIEQASLLRGDPGAAVEAMRTRSPSGAAVMLENGRSVATLRVASAGVRYPLKIVVGCPAQRFLDVDFHRPGIAPQQLFRCDRFYRRLTFRLGAHLSGLSSALYEEVPSGGPSLVSPQ